MEDLRTYLNSMAAAEQKQFAKDCGTTIGYLRKAISSGQKLNPTLCVAIWERSGGVVTRESMRSDHESIWPDLRDGAKRSPGRRKTDLVSGRRKLTGASK